MYVNGWERVHRRTPSTGNFFFRLTRDSLHRQFLERVLIVANVSWMAATVFFLATLWVGEHHLGWILFYSDESKVIRNSA